MCIHVSVHSEGSLSFIVLQTHIQSPLGVTRLVYIYIDLLHFCYIHINQSSHQTMPILSPDHQTHCRDFRHVHLLASTNNNPPISLSTYSQIHNYTIIYPYIFKFFVFKFISLFLGFKHFCVLPFLSILLCVVRPSVRHELYSKTCTFAASLNLFVCLHKLQHKSRK